MNPFRRWIRRVVPLTSRQAVAHAFRRARDFSSGTRLSVVRGDLGSGGYAVHAEITQPIMPGPMFANKLANLSHGARLVNLSLIEPGQTWSFWRHVRKPSEGNGFAVGRNLVNGRLMPQVGGGLCQLSSLMYHLGLLAGLAITERHAHSIDIYHEHERFTPLGADATVVWGFKDLRMSNPHGFAVMIECSVNGDFLKGRVSARGRLPDYDVAFIREQIDAQCVRVDAMVNKSHHTRTLYRQKQGMGLSDPGSGQS